MVKKIQYNYKQESTIENLVYQSWLCRNPSPTIVVYDSGNGFHGRTFKNGQIEKEYGIKAKCGSTENPQSNSILE